MLEKEPDEIRRLTMDTNSIASVSIVGAGLSQFRLQSQPAEGVGLKEQPLPSTDLGTATLELILRTLSRNESEGHDLDVLA